MFSEKIFIATTSIKKIEGVKNALCTEKLDIHAEKAPSGVGEQPYSTEETMIGARNRVLCLMEKYLDKNPKATFIAVEDGVQFISPVIPTINGFIPKPFKLLGRTSIDDGLGMNVSVVCISKINNDTNERITTFGISSPTLIPFDDKEESFKETYSRMALLKQTLFSRLGCSLEWMQ